MEKERLEKVKRLFELYRRDRDFGWLFWNEDLKSLRPYHDFVDLWRTEQAEYSSLVLELYPDPPRDLMEDVKKRMEAYKLTKSGRGNRIPPLS